MERGVSMSGEVNLYEESDFVCMSEGVDAFTFTAGSVASVLALPALPEVVEADVAALEEAGIAGVACA